MKALLENSLIDFILCLLPIFAWSPIDICTVCQTLCNVFIRCRWGHNLKETSFQFGSGGTGKILFSINIQLVINYSLSRITLNFLIKLALAALAVIASVVHLHSLLFNCFFQETKRFSFLFAIFLFSNSARTNGFKVWFSVNALERFTFCKPFWFSKAPFVLEDIPLTQFHTLHVPCAVTCIVNIFVIQVAIFKVPLEGERGLKIYDKPH